MQLSRIMSSASSLVFHRIFVYGTLKRGQPNHHIITNREEFGYSSFVTTAAPGKGKYVSGEIYNVDERMFAKLDELEDYPNLYDRIEVNIDTGTEDGTLVCWVYALTKYPEQLLNLPYLNEYNNSIEQPYMESVTAGECKYDDLVRFANKEEVILKKTHKK